ncbi:MAG: glycoside hydrolase family 3 N-terminal domain-containing protein [Sulfurovaceae bacterium]|nr:glycoside hydrolase family 3 N-terminal domain-containing protein [Sulfurovaceae bacterium]
MNFKFIKSITPLLFLINFSFGATLDQKIGSMLLLGYYGTDASENTEICKDIKEYNLAGVILFDFNVADKTKPKNIISPSQVALLDKQLKKCSPGGKLLIAVDQEGGKVQRLKSKYGFYGNFPSAADVSLMSESDTIAIYEKMAKEMKDIGVNYDFAPVVDLAINPKNEIIVGKGRSYGKDPDIVSKKAKLFIDIMNKNGILTSLKHFPGHGSSLGDTHKGYVDVTNTWSDVELEPYKLLSSKADSIMVAHVFNAKLDPNNPASLSYATVTKLLRWKLGYKGVVITDDLQMGAITSKYSLRETLKLAIKAGDDILLFGNQIDPKIALKPKVLVDTIKDLLAKKEISIEDIDKAYNRVQKLRSKLRS